MQLYAVYLFKCRYILTIIYGSQGIKQRGNFSVTFETKLIRNEIALITRPHHIIIRQRN